MDSRLTIIRLSKAVVVFVYLVVMTAVVLLTLAFFLRLFGANPSADFTEWVYRSVERVMAPFRGIFPTAQITEASVLDFSLLFAMIVYSILGLALHALIDWLAGWAARIDRQIKDTTAVPAQTYQPTGTAYPPPAGTVYAPPPAYAPPPPSPPGPDQSVI